MDGATVLNILNEANKNETKKIHQNIGKSKQPTTEPNPKKNRKHSKEKKLN